MPFSFSPLESPEASLSFDGPPEAVVVIAGKRLQLHAGNAFLGLQSHPNVVSAVCESALRFGLGTATMRSTFTSLPVFDVERRISKVFGTCNTLYFGSGYVCCAALLNALKESYDRFFVDEAAHPAIKDALFICSREIPQPIVFPHRDVDVLESLLKKHVGAGERPIVLTDGVFSTLGTIAPLPDIVRVLSPYDTSAIFVDDASGVGILGPNGLGTLDFYGYSLSQANKTPAEAIPNPSDSGFFVNFLNSNPQIYFCTSMGKAIGTYGGIITGSAAFIEQIAEWTHLFSSSSPPPSPIAAATVTAISLALEQKELRCRLHENMILLQNGLRSLGLDVPDANLPIFVQSIGSAMNMRRICIQLYESGFLVTQLPRMAGLNSDGAIRIAVFATHTPEMIDGLVNELRRVI